MLTHTEFFYDVWAKMIRSKPIPPYVRAPKGVPLLVLNNMGQNMGQACTVKNGR